MRVIRPLQRRYGGRGMPFAPPFSVMTPAPSVSPDAPARTGLLKLRRLVGEVRERQRQTAADRTVALSCRDALSGEPVTGLQVYVYDGAVSVYGTVSSAEVRDTVLGRLAAVPGARSVKGQLQVAMGPLAFV